MRRFRISALLVALLVVFGLMAPTAQAATGGKATHSAAKKKKKVVYVRLGARCVRSGATGRTRANTAAVCRRRTGSLKWTRKAAANKPGVSTPIAAPKAGAGVKRGGTLRYAADQEPTGFNNNTSKDNGFSVTNVVVNLYPGSFSVNEKLQLFMDTDVLESAALTNRSPQTLVYKIRKDAIWSDGTPLTAKDFTYLWENQNGTNKDNDVASTAGYEDIQSVTGSDGGKTVTVVFKKVYPEWKGLFGGFLPSHYMATAGGGWNNGLDKNVPVSGGPYFLKSWNRGKDLTLIRNERYWATKAPLDSIVFRFLPDSATQPAALKNDEVDFIYPQPQVDLVKQVRDNTAVDSKIDYGPIWEHLTLNTKNEFLADVKVRKALALSLDRADIVKRTVGQFDDRAVALQNRIWMTNQPAFEDHGGPYKTQNAAEAKKLLTEAGFTFGGDGIAEKGGKKLSMRISTTTGNALREQQGVLIQAQAKAAGFDIKIDNSPSGVLFGTRLPTGNFDIANFAWVGGLFPASGAKQIYECTSDSNYAKFCDARIDAAVKEVTSELDEAVVAKQLNEIDKLIWEGMPSIPLYQKPTFGAWRKTFGNIKPSPSNSGPFWNSREFFLRTVQ